MTWKTIALGGACLLAGAAFPWSDAMQMALLRTETILGDWTNIASVSALTAAFVGVLWTKPQFPLMPRVSMGYPDSSRAKVLGGRGRAEYAAAAMDSSYLTQGDLPLALHRLVRAECPSFVTGRVCELSMAMKVYAITEDASVFEDVRQNASASEPMSTAFLSKWSDRLPALMRHPADTEELGQRTTVVRLYQSAREKGCLKIGNRHLGWLAHYDPDLWSALLAVDAYGGVRPEGLPLLTASRVNLSEGLRPCHFESLAKWFTQSHNDADEEPAAAEAK